MKMLQKKEMPDPKFNHSFIKNHFKPSNPEKRENELTNCEHMGENNSIHNFKQPCEFCSTVIQPKLKLGPAEDRYEKEADNFAKKIMTMPEQAEHFGSEDTINNRRSSHPVLNVDSDTETSAPYQML